MAEVIKMPKLSDTMEEGVIAAWHKKVGDKISTGDVLAEIESDKATLEFESFHNGVLLHIEADTGKTIPVEEPIAVIGKEGEDFSKALEEARVAAASGGSKKEEEPAAAPAAKPEPAVASPAPAPKKEAPKPAAPVMAKPEVTDDETRVRISPLARRLAQENGVSLRAVRGTGEHGRIVKRDIEKAAKSTRGRDFVGVERQRNVEVSQMRKAIGKSLSKSKFTAPHFYLTIDLDMDRAVESRKAINEAIAPEKVSFNDLVIKAAAVALTEHPQVNASWQDDYITYSDHVHMGVAVAVDEGLLVPVVRFADGKTLTQISGEVRDYAKRARNKKLLPQEWEGSTFTISNLGMFGIEEFTAIINPPNSCIMAVGAIREVPVVKNGQIAISNRMKVTMSCDHRVVDGATGAQFLQTFRQYIENPIVLLGMASI